MIEAVFRNSRYLVWLVVLASMVFAVLLYLSSFKVMLHIICDLALNMPARPGDLQLQAVGMLKALDNLLIAIAFHMVSISHYCFFLSKLPASESPFLKALHIADYHDLKVMLLQVALLILTVVFLERLVEHGSARDTLYLAAGIGIMMFAIAGAIKSIRS